MANKKKIASKSKTKGSKYTKLMAAASKELADKKKTLAKAEKDLAAATKNHAELLQETARLDMLERSLKALVDGTEPPTNVKYVYTYPPHYGNPYGGWWGGNPYGWWWNGGTWTLSTTAVPQNQNYYTYTNANIQQSGQFTTTNATNTINTVTSGAFPSSSSGAVLNTLNSGWVNSDAGSLSTAVCNSSSPSAYTMTTPNLSEFQAELTVDLSTGVTDDEAKTSVEETEPLLEVSI
jgi:hypothetical protein